MDTLKTAKNLENILNDIVKHTVTLERDVALLKRAFRIMSKHISPEGMTKSDRKFLLSVEETVNVFGVVNNQAIEYKEEEHG